MTDAEKIEQLKIICQEKRIPFFEEEDFSDTLKLCNGDLKKTAYRMLIMKSESSTISVSGMNTQDTSDYFKRLALQYRPNNSGILKG